VSTRNTRIYRSVIYPDSLDTSTTLGMVQHALADPFVSFAFGTVDTHLCAVVGCLGPSVLVLTVHTESEVDPLIASLGSQSHSFICSQQLHGKNGTPTQEAGMYLALSTSTQYQYSSIILDWKVIF